MRVLLVGMGCAPAPCPSDKQFVYDLMNHLPHGFEAAVWTLGEGPPGCRPFLGRPEFVLHSRLRLGHGSRASADGYAAHPLHHPLWSMMEITASLAFEVCGHLGRLIRRFQPEILHFVDQPGMVLGMTRRLYPWLPVTVTKATVGMHEGLRRMAYRRWVVAGLRGASRIVTHTSAAARRLEAYGVEAERLVVIPWGTPRAAPLSGDRRRRIRERYGCGEGEPLLVAGLRGDPACVKDDFRGLWAAADRFDLRCVVAARPAQHVLLSRLMFDARPSSRKGRLWLERGPDDFPDLLAAADAFIGGRDQGTNTSLIPLTWLEAIARGTPVIVPDRPGVRECVVDGVHGWVYRPDEQWSSLLARIRRSGPPPRVPGNVTAAFGRRFSIDVVVERYIRVWEDVRRGAESGAVAGKAYSR